MADSVEQKLLFVGREEGKLLEMRQMAARGYEAPMLVFVQSKERATVCYLTYSMYHLEIDYLIYLFAFPGVVRGIVSRFW